MMDSNLKRVEEALHGVLQLAQGGSAVGTGLNTFTGYDKKVAETIAKETGYNFVTADNKFE